MLDKRAFMRRTLQALSVMRETDTGYLWSRCINAGYRTAQLAQLPSRPDAATDDVLSMHGVLMHVHCANRDCSQRARESCKHTPSKTTAALPTTLCQTWSTYSGISQADIAAPACCNITTQTSSWHACKTQLRLQHSQLC